MILTVLRNETIDLEIFFQNLPLRVQEHCKAVSKMTCDIVAWSHAAGLEEAPASLDQDELAKAVLFHDIGLSLIPPELINKTEDLSGPERRVLERHALYGGQILDKFRKTRVAAGREQALWQTAAEIAASHHERWDGKGYPHGIKATAIPFLSRATAIADAFDSISRGSVYRMPLPLDYAALEIMANAGKQFDPDLAEVFRMRYIL